MERYTNFKELKNRTNSNLTSNFKFDKNEKAILSFIDLLRASVIHTPKSIDKPFETNLKTISVTYDR